MIGDVLLENPAKPLFSDRALKRLIFPLVIEQLLAVSVGLMDTVMISSLGDEAISGVSLVDMIMVLIINIFAALATGGAVVAAQFKKFADKRTCACAKLNARTFSAE